MHRARKPLAIISKNPQLSASARGGLWSAFEATGWNTGNLLFQSAGCRRIEGEKRFFDWTFDPAELNASCERAVLICANMINPELDLTDLSERIERLQIPLCVFSVGVQGPLNATEFPLPPGTERFLRVVAERSPMIGLRGNRAGAVFERMGLHNWRVIGCPSNFLQTGMPLAGAFAHAAERLGSPVAVQLDAIDEYTDFATKSADLVAEREFDCFLQAPWSLLRLVSLWHVDQIDDEALSLLAPFGPRDPASALAFAKQRCKAFFSADDWLSRMTSYGFSFGARLHGNIAALQAGIPALIVAHDERVRELADALCAPHVTLPEFFRISSLDQAQDLALAGLDAYLHRRRELAAAFVELLERNGLQPAGMAPITDPPEPGHPADLPSTPPAIGLPLCLPPQEIERLRAHVNLADIADPANVTVLGHLDRCKREDFALCTGSLALYIGDEVASCKQAEQRAMAAAAPAGGALDALNGLDIGFAPRLTRSHLTPVDIQPDWPDAEQSDLLAPRSPGALIARPKSLPFQQDSIDYIVSYYALQLLHDPANLVRIWLRILKPGGGLGLVLPDWRYTRDASCDTHPLGHKWNPSPERMRELYAAHWSDLCDLEQLATLEYKLSFDCVLRRHGRFQPN